MRYIDERRPDIHQWQGRETELATLQSWLADPTVRLIQVTGAGGYGKSSLSAKLCEQIDVAGGWDRLIWSNFSEPFRFAIWGRWLLQHWGIEVPETESDPALIQRIIHHLATVRGLIVLDNLETLLTDALGWHDPAYQQFLLNWLESGSRSVLWVTSREQPPLPNNLRNKCRQWALKGLTEAAGVALLRQGWHIQGATADLAEFVRLVEGHPLLLNLAAGFLVAEEGEAPEITALKRLDVNLFELLGQHRGDPEASVQKLLNASLSRLEPWLRQLLVDVSVYRGKFDRVMAQVMVPDLEVTDKALRAMEQRSLLQAQKSAGGWQFQFQPLIQRYLQQTGGKQTTAHTRAMRYFQERCLPLHKETAASAIAPYLARFYHLCELEHYGWALSSLQSETVEGERYSSCDMFLKFQGSGLDRLELKELYARLLESWHPQTSEECRQFGDALKAIGDVLQFLKQSRDALSRYDEALAIFRSVGARLGEANTLCGIGSLQDDPVQALAAFQAALAIYEQIGDQYSQGRVLLMYLFQAHLQLGQVDAAFEALQTAEEIGAAIHFDLFQQVAADLRAQLQAALNAQA